MSGNYWLIFGWFHSRSNAQLSVVFLEVELLALHGKDTWVLLVDGVDFALELSLALGSGQVIRELPGVSDGLSFLLSDVALVSLVEEVSFPSVAVPETVVHEPIETVVGGGCPSGGGSHVRHVVVVHESSELVVQLVVILVSLGLGLVADELGHEESSETSLNLPISGSSSHLDDIVIGVKVLSGDVLPKDVSSQLDIGVEVLVLEGLNQNKTTKPCWRRLSRWNLLSKLCQVL